MDNFADRRAALRQRIAEACSRAGRDPSDIRLIAVSKTHAEAKVREAIAAGQWVFGENRVQEAARKFAGLRQDNPRLELHLIGPLQTNKADEAVKIFDVIQTLDRPALAEALKKSLAKTGRAPKLYIEVNSAQEPQKAGIAPDQLPGFMDFCRDICGLTISGLMCIPPLGQEPRHYFTALRDLADQYNLPHISMGMSDDFETAIECGATEIRVGSALFGDREGGEKRK